MSSPPRHPLRPDRRDRGKRLADQLRFVLEIDRLKGIVRQTPLIDGSRNETDAEHTWHLATMALGSQRQQQWPRHGMDGRVKPGHDAECGGAFATTERGRP